MKDERRRRRRRALFFGLSAAFAALMAAVVAKGYSGSVAETYGELRPVVVLTKDLAAGRPITAKVLRSGLAVRQVPEMFVPEAALSSAEPALGLVPVATLPADSYLAANLIRPPASRKESPPRVGAGRHPVELEVSGSGSLTEVPGGSSRVDVLVTGETKTGSGSHTYMAAARVPLLAIGQAGQSDFGPDLARVTLALTRPQALVLVEAQTFARRLTVLPSGGR